MYVRRRSSKQVDKRERLLASAFRCLKSSERCHHLDARTRRHSACASGALPIVALAQPDIRVWARLTLSVCRFRRGLTHLTSSIASQLYCYCAKRMNNEADASLQLS